MVFIINVYDNCDRMENCLIIFCPVTNYFIILHLYFIIIINGYNVWKIMSKNIYILYET